MIGPTLEGVLRKDKLGWVTHDQVRTDHNGMVWMNRWFVDRVKQIPDGAYVRITVEVLDPHPERKETGR